MGQDGPRVVFVVPELSIHQMHAFAQGGIQDAVPGGYGRGRSETSGGGEDRVGCVHDAISHSVIAVKVIVEGVAGFVARGRDCDANLAIEVSV